MNGIEKGDDTVSTDTENTFKTTDDHNESGGGKKAVRFSMNSSVWHEVESHVNFSEKERRRYWWNDHEKDRMMSKHERLVAKYEQCKQTKPSSKNNKRSMKILQNYRGLESWTAAGSLKLDYSIERCVSAVMDEQDRQWNDNDNEDDAIQIANCSAKVTDDSARRARLNGLQDAQEALRVRGESWTINGSSDELSLASVASYGTAAIVKKKKRSKLLARLDDSYKERNESSLKKDKKKGKKKKKSSTSTIRDSNKTKKKKKSKSKNYDNNNNNNNDDDDDSNGIITNNEIDKHNYNDNKKTNNNKTNVDVSERKVTITQNVKSVSATRQRKEKKNTTKKNRVTGNSVVDGLNSSIISTPSCLTIPPISSMSKFLGSSKEDMVDDESPLLLTLRRQQQILRQDTKNSTSQKKVEILIPTTNDIHNNEKQRQVISDPPGRRPRRVKSIAIPGNSHSVSTTSSTKSTVVDMLSDSTGRRMDKISESYRSTSSVASSITEDSSGARRKSGGIGIQSNLRGMRSNATNFFKTRKGSSADKIKKKKAVSTAATSTRLNKNFAKI